MSTSPSCGGVMFHIIDTLISSAGSLNKHRCSRLRADGCRAIQDHVTLDTQRTHSVKVAERGGAGEVPTKDDSCVNATVAPLHLLTYISARLRAPVNVDVKGGTHMCMSACRESSSAACFGVISLFTGLWQCPDSHALPMCDV
jgi:hypothetical protein